MNSDRLPVATWIGLGGAVAAAVVLNALGASAGAATAMVLAVGGLIAGGFAVARRPKGPLTLLLAALTALLAALGVNPAWDSVRLVPLVMAAVAVAAAGVVALPRPAQYAVVSGLAVFHFAGVLSAITSPPPQSWLSHWAWVTLFRPHLVFCYTNNAYQFYSPEPGPASLLWFCVERADGEKVWYKLPHKPESRLDPMAVQFYRRLSITESANQNEGTGPSNQVANRRMLRTDIPILNANELPLSAQYRQPQELTRRWIASFARHVADQYGGKGHVRGVKVYRVTHQMLTAQQFAEGNDPFDPATYYPYYLGEYDAEGNLVDPNDPMLFWLVPILKRSGPVGPLVRTPGLPVETINYLAQHAGSDPFASK
jgi:hypothetical protein